MHSFCLGLLMCLCKCDKILGIHSRIIIKIYTFHGRSRCILLFWLSGQLDCRCRCSFGATTVPFKYNVLCNPENDSWPGRPTIQLYIWQENGWDLLWPGPDLQQSEVAFIYQIGYPDGSQPISETVERTVPPQIAGGMCLGCPIFVIVSPMWKMRVAKCKRGRGLLRLLRVVQPISACVACHTQLFCIASGHSNGKKL